MARISKGTTYGLSLKDAEACRYLALGRDFNEVAQYCYGHHPSPELQKGDPFELEKWKKKDTAAARKKLRNMMKDPRFMECYKAIIKEIIFPTYGEAVQAVKKQISNENGWLANKAANDILSRFETMVFGEDSKEIVIKVEGMPTLGSPEPADEEEASVEDDQD